jgi:hypothetical protein
MLPCPLSPTLRHVIFPMLRVGPNCRSLHAHIPQLQLDICLATVDLPICADPKIPSSDHLPIPQCMGSNTPPATCPLQPTEPLKDLVIYWNPLTPIGHHYHVAQPFSSIHFNARSGLAEATFLATSVCPTPDSQPANIQPLLTLLKQALYLQPLLTLLKQALHIQPLLTLLKQALYIQPLLTLLKQATTVCPQTASQPHSTAPHPA